MNYQQILQDIYEEIKPHADEGKQADYIPALAQVNPDQFGIFLQLLSGETYTLGAYDQKFSIQSISKVFSLAIALSILGKSLWERIGKEPSGSAFNSLVQLEYEHGKPRNPFINAGAIVVADVLLSNLDDPEQFFLNFVRQLSGNEHIDYSPNVASSEQSCSYLNASIAYLLKHHGNLHNRVEGRPSPLLHDVFCGDELSGSRPCLRRFCSQQRTFLLRRCHSLCLSCEAHQCNHADMWFLR